MEKVIVLCWVFILMLGFVFASDWAEINIDGEVKDTVDAVEVVNIDENDGDDIDSSSVNTEDVSVSRDFTGDTFYTGSFYTALGVGIVVLIGMGIVVWLLIRGPRNKWEK